METLPDDPPIPFTLLECAFRQLTRELCEALPPAATPQERTDRMKAAIAQVAALHPANTVEFVLAGQFALASLRSQRDLAKADEPGLPSADILKWNSQSNNKARQANSTLRSLLRLQAERRQTESDPKAFDRGERIEDHMTALMADAVFGPQPVSPHAPESHTPVIASPAQPGVAIQANRTPPPVSRAAVIASPAQPGVAIQANRTQPPVSRAAVIASPAQPGVAIQANRTQPPVSPRARPARPSSRARRSRAWRSRPTAHRRPSHTTPPNPTRPSSRARRSRAWRSRPTAHRRPSRAPPSSRARRSRARRSRPTAPSRPSHTTTRNPTPKKLRLP